MRPAATMRASCAAWLSAALVIASLTRALQLAQPRPGRRLAGRAALRRHRGRQVGVEGVERAIGGDVGQGSRAAEQRRLDGRQFGPVGLEAVHDGAGLVAHRRRHEGQRPVRVHRLVEPAVEILRAGPDLFHGAPERRAEVLGVHRLAERRRGALCGPELAVAGVGEALDERRMGVVAGRLRLAWHRPPRPGHGRPCGRRGPRGSGRRSRPRPAADRRCAAPSRPADRPRSSARPPLMPDTASAWAALSRSSADCAAASMASMRAEITCPGRNTSAPC